MQNGSYFCRARGVKRVPWYMTMAANSTPPALETPHRENIYFGERAGPIPESLGRLSKLVSLDLSYNGLNGE